MSKIMCIIRSISPDWVVEPKCPEKKGSIIITPHMYIHLTAVHTHTHTHTHTHLKGYRCLIPSVDNLGNVVPNVLCTTRELWVSFQFVQLVCLLKELLIAKGTEGGGVFESGVTHISS